MHGEQKRESGEPYVTHPLNVALIATQLKLDVPSIVTALLHDVVEDTGTSLPEVESSVRRGGRASGRRRHQGFENHLLQPRGKAGGEFPQDDHRDGPGYPGRPGQAGGPPAQHAHARPARARTAAGNFARDAGDLRPHRASARHLLDEVGARGQRVPLRQSRRVLDAQDFRGEQARRARGLHPRGDRDPHQAAGRFRRPGRSHRTAQALLLDPHEDAGRGPHLR